MAAADLCHVEAQFLAKRLALRALAGGRNLIWEITMASQPTVESGLAADGAAGYTAVAVFVDLCIEVSVRRSGAMHRHQHEEYLQGRGFGGRYVPAAAIRALADTPDGPEPQENQADPTPPGGSGAARPEPAQTRR
jgi:hypothetical protein